VAKDSFKVKKSLNVEPISSPTLDQDGDIAIDSATNKLKVRLNSTTDSAVLEAATQTLTNKTLTAPTIDVVTLDGQASAPSNPSAGYYKVYVDDTTSKLQLLDSSGTVTTVGSGAGGAQNFITNGDAEAATTGWATYADAAGTSPVDGTGGSPTVTWTRSTSSPLTGLASFLFTKDAANRQGQGASYDFTINRADQAKVCRIDFDYEVASGTYADGDLTVWLYDVTNAQLIQPSASSILNAVGPQKKQSLSFQTNSNSTSYRLIIHVASTSASAYTVKFDNLSVVRESISQGTVVTDWVSYTPALNDSTNVSSNVAQWRRNGDTLEVIGYLQWSGAGVGAFLTAAIPSGLSMNTTKQVGTLGEHTNIGVFNYLDNGTNYRTGSVATSGTGTVYFTPDSGGGSYANTQFTTSDKLSYNFKVPIVGWSSSQQLSSDADTRVVAMTARNYSNGTLASGASHTVILNTVATDTHGAYNSATGEYTVKVPGNYSINGEIGMTATAAAATRQLFLYIAVNGTVISSTYTYANTTSTINHRAQARINWYCNAGDVIKLVAENDLGGTGTPVAGVGNSNFSINLIQGPAQIAASANVACLATGDPASASSGNPIIVPTTIFDTHQGYSASTGRYTCQIAGVYNIFGALSSASSATTLTIYKNGSSYALAGNLDSNGEATFSGSVSCIAGDIIDIRPGGTVDATSMSLNIQRLGGVG